MEGDAVRDTVVGDMFWQFRMGGAGWKQSVHHPDRQTIALDPELADDVRTMRDHFDLSVWAVDGIIRVDGAKHLLKLNHTPDVAAFPELRSAYLQ